MKIPSLLVVNIVCDSTWLAGASVRPSLVFPLSESLARYLSNYFSPLGLGFLMCKKRELNRVILSLSYAGNLDSIIQTCTCCEVQ